MYDDDREVSGGGLSIGAVAIFALAALFFVVMGLIFSMLAGLFAAPLLMLAARVPPGNGRLDFWHAYGTATAGTFVFLAIVIALLYALPDHVSMPALSAIDHALPHLLPSRLQSASAWAPNGVWPTSLLMVAVPALAGFALVLRRVGPPFNDAFGFLRSMLAGVPALAVGLGCAGAIVALALERVQSRHIELASALTSTFYLAVLVFLFALAAALVTGAVLVMVTRWLWRHPDATYRRAYGTAFGGLLAYLSVTGGVIFLLPDGNPLPRYAFLLGHSGSPALLMQAIQHHPIAGALQSLLLAQLPGLAVMAAIVAGGLSDAYRGVAGYLRALVAGTTGIVAVAVCMVAVNKLIIGV